MKNRLADGTVKISVIIPVYNAARYLEECITSVSRQTFTDFEILCIDDCSTDDSLMILKKLQEQEPRLEIVQNEYNLGAGPTRNRGIDLACGKYFLFLDADDFIENTLMEKVYRRAEKDALQLCLFPHIYLDDKTGKMYEVKQIAHFFKKRYQEKVFSWEDVQGFFYQSVFCVPWNRLYLTEFVRSSSIRFPALKNSEDLYFGNGLVTQATRIGLLDTDVPMIYYRQNIPQQISATVAQAPDGMLKSFELLYDLLHRTGKWEDCRKSFNDCAVNLLLFPISVMENKREGLRFLKEEGFGRLGMDCLRREDFPTWSAYEQYRQICDELEMPRVPRDFLSLWKADDLKREEVLDYLQRADVGKTALWGLGKKGRYLCETLAERQYQFDFLIDNSESKRGMRIGDREIRPAGEYLSEISLIVITNTDFWTDVREKMNEFDVQIPILDLDVFLRYGLTVEECI